MMQTSTISRNTFFILSAIAIGLGVRAVQGFSVLHTDNLLAKPSSSRTNTNIRNIAAAVVETRTNNRKMMIIKQNEIDISTESNECTGYMNPSQVKVTTSTSLAANYIIYINDGQSKYEPTTWTLVPLEKTVQHSDDGGKTAKKNIGEGTIAIDALQSSINDSDKDGAFKLICAFVKQREGEDDSIKVTVEKISSMSMTDAQEQEVQINELIATLSRIMIQKKTKDFGLLTPSLSVSLPSKEGTVTSETFLAQDIVSSPSSNDNDKNEIYSTCNPTLHHSLLPSSSDISSIEMSDMVDSLGNILGAIPRILVHKFNILHRGIGIVVCDQEHIIKEKEDMSENNRVDIDTNASIYCHRRTDTKRIFPSLYDMFVGGVSMSGENEKLTAAREVAEELGLGKALNCMESPSSFDITSPLSDPLFKCTVCTSYNRCVVTMFTYKYISSDESIKWQEEEVSWGNLVPYHIVERAAAMSINRLVQDGKWPGVSDDIDIGKLDEDDNNLSESQAELDSDETYCSDSHWKDWDFVPDGLLVWVAWLQWVQK